jgi:hypothetical protein
MIPDMAFDMSGNPSRWVRRFAPLIAPGGRVLDLACGSGRHSLCCWRRMGFRSRRWIAMPRPSLRLAPGIRGSRHASRTSRAVRGPITAASLTPLSSPTTCSAAAAADHECARREWGADLRDLHGRQRALRQALESGIPAAPGRTARRGAAEAEGRGLRAGRGRTAPPGSGPADLRGARHCPGTCHRAAAVRRRLRQSGISSPDIRNSSQALARGDRLARTLLIPHIAGIARRKSWLPFCLCRFQRCPPPSATPAARLRKLRGFYTPPDGVCPGQYWPAGDQPDYFAGPPLVRSGHCWVGASGWPCTPWAPSAPAAGWAPTGKSASCVSSWPARP